MAGFVTAWMAPDKPAFHAAILSVSIGAIALLSLALQFRSGSVWSELATVLLMAPAALLAGRMRVGQTQR